MSRECMPKNVRREVMEYSGLFSVPRKQLPKRLPGHGPATVGYEQIGTRTALQQQGSTACQIKLDCLNSRFSHRNQAVLVAFAKHSHDTHVELDIRNSHFAQLGYPQSGSIEQFEHRTVAQALRLRDVGRCDKGIDLLFI